MKTSLMFVLILFFSNARAGLPLDINILTRETLAVSCSDEELRQDIRQQKTIVPSVIYHYGPKALLLEDVVQRNIPEAAWKEFIMGQKTRYSLPYERRGLYGTAAIDTNSFYNGQNINWMIEIHIKPECQKPDRVFSLMDFWTDPRFVKWYEKQNFKKIYSLKQIEEMCFHINDEFEGFLRDECRDIVLPFLKAHNIAVLQDHLIRKSFYIRDRNCISNILGNSHELIEILATRKYLWKPICGESYELNGILPKLLMHVLADLKNSELETHFDEIRSNSKNLLPPSQELVVEALAAHSRCKIRKSDQFKDLLKNQNVSKEILQKTCL